MGHGFLVSIVISETIRYFEELKRILLFFTNNMDQSSTDQRNETHSFRIPFPS
jgi:hypothetical protein